MEDFQRSSDATKGWIDVEEEETIKVYYYLTLLFISMGRCNIFGEFDIWPQFAIKIFKLNKAI